MDETDKNGAKRDEKGRFGIGNCANPNGRPRNPEFKKLREALKNVESEEDKIPIFEHFVREAYKDNTVLVSLMRKLLPDLKMVEADIKTEGFRIIIERPQNSLNKPQGKPGEGIDD